MKLKNKPGLFQALFFGAIQLISLTILFFLIDYFSKDYIHTHFNYGESLPVIGDFIRITYVRNYTIAFSFLSRNQWYGLPLAIFVIGTITILIVSFQSFIFKIAPPRIK
jgi:lipoprotein signal peptidase